MLWNGLVEPIPPKNALILVVQAAVLSKSPSCLVLKKWAQLCVKQKTGTMVKASHFFGLLLKHERYPILRLNKDKGSPNLTFPLLITSSFRGLISRNLTFPLLIISSTRSYSRKWRYQCRCWFTEADFTFRSNGFHQACSITGIPHHWFSSQACSSQSIHIISKTGHAKCGTSRSLPEKAWKSAWIDT